MKIVEKIYLMTKLHTKVGGKRLSSTVELGGKDLNILVDEDKGLVHIKHKEDGSAFTMNAVNVQTYHPDLLSAPVFSPESKKKPGRPAVKKDEN